MEYRNLGRTGVKVSPLCLGNLLSGENPEEQAEHLAILDRALEAGINFLDTANSYGRGARETRLGEALKRNGKRNRVVLTTKVHVRMADDDPNMQGNARRHIVEQCHASLKRLQTDWVDLLLIHRPQSDIPVDETLRALDDLVRAGKVRYIGSSSFAAWQVVESLWVSKELGLNRFVCEQPPYHLLDRRVERELVPMALTYGLAVTPFTPLAGGILTGKYRRGQAWPEDARYQRAARASGPNWQVPEVFSDATYTVVEALAALADEKGCTPSQLALAWLIQQPGITSPVIGPRKVAQLDDNLGALQVTITAADREKLDAVSPRGGCIASYYEADFGPHAYRW